MTHELGTFLRQVESQLAAEYERIIARATEDPGTAGEEGEENWADLLRSWLPENYHVVTRGRLLSVDGNASPQVDVLVLKPSYPPALRDKKVYLTSGVAAAFECKTTLRKGDIESAFSTALHIQQLAHPGPRRNNRYGTPYNELHGEILFGLLAHSHSWTSATAFDHVTETLSECVEVCNHPREVLDVACVADLGTWMAMRMSYSGPTLTTWYLDQLRDTFPDGYAGCGLVGPDPETFTSVEPKFPNIPVAQLCAYITNRLAWEDPSMRSMADYFRMAGMFGSGKGHLLPWDLDSVYSEEVAQALRAGEVNQLSWDHWRLAFF